MVSDIGLGEHVIRFLAEHIKFSLQQDNRLTTRVHSTVYIKNT